MANRGGGCLLLGPLKDRTPGRHKLEVELDVRTFFQTNSFNFTAAQERPTGPDVRIHKVALDIEVLESAEPVPTIPATEEIDKQLAEALRPQMAMLWNGGTFSGAQLHLQIAVGGASVPCCFDASARQGEREWNIGTLTTGKLADVMMWGWSGLAGQVNVGGEVRGMKPGPIDLVLRPSPAKALYTVDLDRIYGGEVTIKDFDVTSQDSFGTSGGGLMQAIVRSLLGG
jgi:hypothetical protein